MYPIRLSQGISLIQSTPLSVVDFIPPPDPEGRIASGQRFATSIRFLLADPLCRIGPPARDHFLLLADYSELLSAPESAADLKTKDWRAAHSRREWQYLALIRDERDRPAITWLRLAALHSCITAKNLRATSGTRHGANLLYKLLSTRRQLESKSPLYEAIRYYDAKLRNGTNPQDIPRPDILRKLDVGHVDALTFALIALSPDPIRQTTLQGAVRKWATSMGGGGVARPKTLPTVWSGPDLPPNDLYETPPAIVAPRGTDLGPEIPETGKTDTVIDQIGESLIYENWLAEHWATVHLAGALLPNSDRALTSTESLAVSKKLMELSLAGEQHSIPSICALTYLICILTSQPRQLVLGALAHLAMENLGADKLAAWIGWDSFTCWVPGADAFGSIRPGTEHCLDPVEQSYSRAWPAFVKSSLSRLPLRDEKLWRQAEATWKEGFDAVKSELARITPRIP